MTKIITHSGMAHLDDFLSTCFILYKDKNVDIVLRQTEISEEELNDPTIWKVDISMTYDPKIKAFDHHQEGIDSCSFSLLLKHWDIWEKANEVYPWIATQDKIDISGLRPILKKYGISHNVYFQLNSSIETMFKERFQKFKKIDRNNGKHKLMFLIMQQIGKEFFTGISTYYRLLESFDSQLDVQFISTQRLDEDPSKGILVLSYLTEKPQYGSHLFNIFLKYKISKIINYRRGWITAFTYDRPEGTICLKRHGNPAKIDFSRITSLDKTRFAHRNGFVAVVDKMPEFELYNYIQHAIKNN